MLALPHTNSWGFIYTNQANGSTTPGTSVTPGASDVEGSWTQIAASGSITAAILFARLRIHSGNTSTASKQHLLDFGWDPAGGTSYTAFCSDYACGGSSGASSVVAAGSGVPFEFPCQIPSGSSIAVRVQGSRATAGALRVVADLFGKPSRPELWRPAAYSETLGYTSGTLGTSFTPGNASFGSWVSLGSPSKKHFWAQLGVQVDNATQNAEGTRLQLGIGDGTNMHVIQDCQMMTNTAEELLRGHVTPCTWEIPSGSTLYVRGNCSGAPASGYNATAVLFGG